MKIKTRISFNEYLKLLLGLTYRKPMLIFVLFADLLLILWIAGYFTGVASLPKPTIYQYITVTIISVIQPLLLINAIRKNYQSSNHLKEALELNFTRENINVQGESFYMVLSWEKIFKVSELKNWFLVYQNNFSAIIIPKRSITKDQLNEFTALLKSIPHLKLYLKND